MKNNAKLQIKVYFIFVIIFIILLSQGTRRHSQSACIIGNEALLVMKLVSNNY